MTDSENRGKRWSSSKIRSSRGVRIGGIGKGDTHVEVSLAASSTAVVANCEGNVFETHPPG